jgi:hypothetical protein
MGPHKANVTAPSVDAAGEYRRRRNNQPPSAASGNGAATHKLNPTTSLPISRMRTAGSRNI